jgi:hypothetical protein
MINSKLQTKRAHRKARVLKRKNFLPTLIVTLLLWLATASLIYFIDPQTFGAVPIFFVAVFTSLLFTFSLIFAESRRGLIAAIALTLFLLLAYLGVGNLLNLALIIAIAIVTELYFSYK